MTIFLFVSQNPHLSPLRYGMREGLSVATFWSLPARALMTLYTPKDAASTTKTRTSDRMILDLDFGLGSFFALVSFAPQAGQKVDSSGISFPQVGQNTTCLLSANDQGFADFVVLLTFQSMATTRTAINPIRRRMRKNVMPANTTNLLMLDIAVRAYWTI